MATSQLAQAGSVQPLPPVTGADNRLGLDDILPGTPPGQSATWAGLAAAAGARVNRWEFRWDRIEPSAGIWSFAADDAAVAASQAAGIGVEGILIGTPGWAVARGQKPGNGVPKGLYRPVADPRNLWATYVRQTVLHYRGLVRWWEVWNEPDLSFFWSGTPAEYSRLLGVAERVIRSLDPTAHVVLAGMVVPDLAFVSSVLSRVAASPTGPAFDIAAWHAYGDAAQVYTNLLRFRALLNADGLGSKQIWVTEDGFPASNPNGEPRQAAYVLQTIVYALAAGASRILVYRASDDPSGKEWGLLSASGAPRMGYVAFQIAARYLSHVAAIVRAPSPNLERFTFYRRDQRVTVFWTRGVQDHQVTLQAAQPLARLVDWTGQTSAAIPAGGRLRLMAPGAAYNAGIDASGKVVGGPPTLEIENNTPPADLGPAVISAPVTGAQRKMVLFNPSSQPESVQVAPAGTTAERIVVQLPADSVRSVDLDLLAGPDFSGPYVFASTGPLAEQALSESGDSAAVAPTTQWYLPAAPARLALMNGSGSVATATVTVFGWRGHILARSAIVLGPHASAGWDAPPGPGVRRSAVTVTATAPVAVWAQPAVSAVPAPSTSWFAVRPAESDLTLFNPGTAPAAVDVHYIGAPAVSGEQLRLPAHHSYLLPTEAAQAVSIVSSQPLTAATAGTPSASAGLSSQTTIDVSLALAGESTGVAVYNPADRPAHVSVSIVIGDHVRQSQLTVDPGQVSSVPARRPASAPSGVSLQSDTPIVASAE
ncbi:MAG TPA: hypothetical protein VKX16_19660 [Chloroflexota bacterium]|nr:hypothetical protein [Chloroflexota bacterium]